MARSGQLRGKVSEQQLLGVLEQVEANERGANGEGADGKGKIVVRSAWALLTRDVTLAAQFQRRKAASNDGFGSSDDDDVSFRPSVRDPPDSHSALSSRADVDGAEETHTRR
jgi:hypothetical protein